MKSSFKSFQWACWERLAKVMAGSYIVGPELEDALRVCRRLAPSRTSTVCYWNTDEESPQKVASAYIRAIDALAKENLDGYLSIKAPALGFDRRLFTQALERGRSQGVSLHFDALAPEAADETFAMIAEALPQYPDLGCTLPGRWRRSLGDADWAVVRQLRVRVVKGQWPDPMKPEVESRHGFLAVIDRLAGRARHVAVATHDPILAQEALERLLRTNTSCELELLYGLPLEPSSRIAHAAGVAVRLYLPYGHGWLPYSISQVYKNPRILWWMLRDLWPNHRDAV
jgi:proline dehydrogenase